MTRTRGAIVGISVGPNTGLQIAGNVFGDIVANLTASGRLTDSDHNPANGEDGGILLATNIVGIKTSPLVEKGENGNIGNIITAGSVSNLQISGQVQGIYAGDGVFRAGSHIAVDAGGGDRLVSVNIGLDVNPVLNGVQGGFDFFKSNAQIASLQSPDGASISNVSLQSGRDLQIFAGDGGFGLGAGQGGNGGAIKNINVQATDATLLSGAGGDSAGAGGGGNGGMISNSGTLSTASGTTLKPMIVADKTLAITSGDGGSPGAFGKTATGGSGGAISGMVVSLSSGDIQILAGSGGDGNGAAGGAGGGIFNLNATNLDGGLSATTGDGGNALAGKFKGGAGGALSGLVYQLSLALETEVLEKAYNVILTTGDGGSSAGGAGGAGGALTHANLTLDPSNFPAFDPSDHNDTTLLFSISTGNGGDGATGGAGGAITGVNSQSIFDQVDPNTNLVIIDSVAANFSTGHGGAGTAGVGGAGGSASKIALQGITHFSAHSSAFGNPAFKLTTGNGGDGTTKGGAGGAIGNLLVSTPQNDDNTVFGALLYAGKGGDASANGGIGGAGGSISGLTNNAYSNSAFTVIQAGDGGEALAGTGGLGGSVSAINTIGFIGLPSTGSLQMGVFANHTGNPGDEVAQGIFVGRGGVGSDAAHDGLAGSVKNIVARQIAAIAATVASNGTFGVATSVSGVTADVIGYDANGNNTFDSSIHTNDSPSTVQPTDGFILAKAISNILTLEPTRTQAFTFHS